MSAPTTPEQAVAIHIWYAAKVPPSEIARRLGMKVENLRRRAAHLGAWSHGPKGSVRYCECGSKVKAKMVCDKHYQKWVAHVTRRVCVECQDPHHAGDYVCPGCTEELAK